MASFATEWHAEPEHGVLVSQAEEGEEEGRAGCSSSCATQTSPLGAYVWSVAALPRTGRVYWELEYELPKPGVPAASWITREDLQRYVEESDGGAKGGDKKAQPPAAAACCGSKPHAPPAQSTRKLLRRLGGNWTMRSLTKKLDELANTAPADIEWPAPPEPPTLRRGDPLGGAYFAGVVERALQTHCKSSSVQYTCPCPCRLALVCSARFVSLQLKALMVPLLLVLALMILLLMMSDPIAGETVLRSKEGAWGLSNDKNNGESHLREDGQPAGAVPDEHLNAGSFAFGHLERVGILADMDSTPRVLQFYRDGMLIPTATVSGFPETVYIAATPKKKGVKVRLTFPGGPVQSVPRTDSSTDPPAARRDGKALWKVAATAVEPHLASAAAAERKPSVWTVAQEVVRKRRADFKHNKTPCAIEYIEPGPLGIAFGYEGGITWVEAVSRSGMTARLTSSMERDIEGYVVSEVDGKRARGFDEIADQIQSAHRPIAFVFTHPTKEEEKVMRSAEKEWIKEDRRGEKAKLQEAKAAAKVTKQEMKEETAAYQREVKQASKINKETVKLVRGSNERHTSKAKAGWKNLKRKMPEELKRKKKTSLFEMAAQEQANMEALVAKSAPHRSLCPADQATSLRPAVRAASLREDETETANRARENVVHNAGLASTRAKTRNALLQGLRDGKLALAVELAESDGAGAVEVRESLAQRRAAHETKVDDSRGRGAATVKDARLSATRAKTRGALLQGLRSGKLAAAVETLDANAASPALRPAARAETSRQEPAGRDAVGRDAASDSAISGNTTTKLAATEAEVEDLRQQLHTSKLESAELGALKRQREACFALLPAPHVLTPTMNCCGLV